MSTHQNSQEKSNWKRLFPDGDYQFRIGIRSAESRDFFQPKQNHLSIVDERTRWLESKPDAYAALHPAGRPLLDELIEHCNTWNILNPQESDRLEQARLQSHDSACLALSKTLEPDFLLLEDQAQHGFHLIGGSVCFPSSWSLQDKMGRPMSEIHEVVPGLNETLGTKIDTFLKRITPGTGWERENWGLSPNPELNHHPHRVLPTYKSEVTLDQIWLRLEHQHLLLLPRTRGLVFAIRVTVHALQELLVDDSVRIAFEKALRSMPDEIATYKGVQKIRSKLLSQIRAIQTPTAP